MYALFLDEHRSSQYLKEYQNEFMFNEMGQGDSVVVKPEGSEKASDTPMEVS